MAKSVRDDLQKIIGDAYTAGLSVDKTAAQIVQLSDQFSRAQSRALARTDLNGIANGGAHLAAQEVGVGFKTWLTADDDLVRPTHEDANGQTVPINDPFDVGGESLDYPGDPEGSDAETINCRCTLTFGDAGPDGSDSGDVSASGAITLGEGGDLSEAQITIPPTVSVGTATSGASGITVTKVDDGGVTFFADKAGDFLYVDTSPTALPSFGQYGTEMRAQGHVPWLTTLCVEGVPTVDNGTKRMLALGGGTWKNPPIPIGIMYDSPHADLVAEAPICARADYIWRDGNEIRAMGVFTPDDVGQKAAAYVGEKFITGISIDPVDVEFEAMMYVNGGAIALADESDLLDALEDYEVINMFKTYMIAGATICPVQALTDATIALLAGGDGELTNETSWTLMVGDDLVASAVEAEAPLRPPAAWFDDPQLDRPTLVTVTDDGRVFGHVAPWRGCHTGYAGRCVPPPRSRTGYAHFHVGRIETAEGDLLPVGRLTIGGGHADINANEAAARRHYDDVTSVVAFVRAGEDAHGPWIAGALRSACTPQMIQDLLANPLSGDWRNGEMVAAHAVPVPGFPILQASAIGETGEEETALILTSTIGLFENDDEVDFAVRSRVLAASARGVSALAELARS